MKQLKIKFVITLLVLFTFLGLAKICVADISIIELKTTEKTIRVTGTGFPPDNTNFSIERKKKMAERAAVVDGYRKLLERVVEIRVDSKTTIQNYVTQNDTITVKIDGIVKGAKQVAVRHHKGGMAEVDMEITLGRDFYDFFQPYIKTLK